MARIVDAKRIQTFSIGFREENFDEAELHDDVRTEEIDSTGDQAMCDGE